MKKLSRYLEKIFSVTNDQKKTHKVITLLGIKVKFKRKPKEKLCAEDREIMKDKSLYVGIPDNITLQMSFNNDCNCRCKFCSESIATNKENREVIPEKWLYDYLLPLYPKTANLVPTYGEITYCKEGYEYLSFLNKNYHHINIFAESNGIAFNDKWCQLATDNLMNMHFSINAINDEYFRKTVWDKAGVYDVVQKNVNRYLDVLKEKGLLAFTPSVSCVLNSSNYETIVEFVRQYVSRGIQHINFYFDHIENETFNYNKSIKNSKVEEAIITLIELDRILEGKIHLFYRLFLPTNNIQEYDKIVDNENIEDLRKKYADIFEICKDMNLRELYAERDKLREFYGKKKYSMYENFTGCTFHQKIYNGYSICTNPWNHIRLRPNGLVNYCSWTPYLLNLKSFIKNDKIDWNEFFNCLYYRKARKNFKNRCYCNCMPSCPGIENLSKQEFTDLYGSCEEVK